ncbi:MAG: HigA family addiction module antidote protein [Anaerolineae bacterium]|nr:HigA family addiction module antidote protein [Anaerolineae bacterium]
MRTPADATPPPARNERRPARRHHRPRSRRYHAVRRVQEIILEKRVVTADTALRLARYFGTSAHFWLGLQMDYDLDVAEDELDDRIRLASR